MTTTRVCESLMEGAALDWFETLGWSVLRCLETAIGDHQ